MRMSPKRSRRCGRPSIGYWARPKTLLNRSTTSRSSPATVLLGRPELGLVAHDGVCGDEELSGDRDERNLGRLAGRAQALVERFEPRIVARRGDGGHVEGVADPL